MSSRSSNALIFVALLFACRSPEQEPARTTVDAQIVTAQRMPLPAFHSVAGTVRAETTSMLAANVVGTVIGVRVAEGSRVHAGDVLVEIDAREPRAQADRARAGRAGIEHAIDAAAANAQLADRTFSRFAALHESGSASQQEYDEAKSRQTAAQAELARLIAARGEARAATTQAETVLGYSTVRAPIDGVVTARFVDPGAQAAPGVPLVTIENELATRVDASLPENVVVRVGDRAVVNHGDERLNATITHVQPSLDPAVRTALVKLALERPLRAGTYVNVSFPIGVREAISIPLSAVVHRGQLTSVFVVGADHIARMRLVTIRSTDATHVEVLSGLAAGESVVANPAGVRDGVIVRSGA